MATMALDLTTIGHALATLEETFLGRCEWRSFTPEQTALLNWYSAHREECLALEGMLAKASTSADELNAFLANNGFPELQFDPFEGVGVVSILDVLVEWLQTASVTRILGQYPAFKIGHNGASVFDTDDGPLALLATRSGHTLWLHMPDRPPQHGVDLAMTAQKLAKGHWLPNRERSGVVVPKLDISVQPDLSWLGGMDTFSPKDGYHVISQAFQGLRFRANQFGAHAHVATGIATERGIAAGPRPLVFDKPFIGFLTPPGSALAIAAFYADVDCWREPAKL